MGSNQEIRNIKEVRQFLAKKKRRTTTIYDFTSSCPPKDKKRAKRLKEMALLQKEYN